MASNHIINTSRARHESSLRITNPLKKLVFERLLSNEFTSRSGIYVMMSGNLADIVHCETTDKNGDIIRDEKGNIEFLNSSQVKKVVQSLADDEKVLMYEPVSHVVYILNFVEMVPFGLSADLISEALLKEYKNYRNEDFWKHFFTNNYDYIIDYLIKSEEKSERSARSRAKKIAKISKKKFEDVFAEIDYVKTTENMQKLKDLIKPYKKSS